MGSFNNYVDIILPFLQHCDFSALQISKKHFAMLDFFLYKMKYVSTVVHINATMSVNFKMSLRKISFIQNTKENISGFLP